MQTKAAIMKQIAEKLDIPFINTPSKEATQRAENSDVGVPFVNNNQRIEEKLMRPKYPDIEVELTGQDGNAFAIMGAVTKAMKSHKVPSDEITAFRNEAMSGDYDNLLRTTMNWVSVS